MSESEIRDLLISLIENDCDDELDGETPRLLTFEEAGLLTRDEGFVLKLGEKEFQITIVRSN